MRGRNDVDAVGRQRAVALACLLSIVACSKEMRPVGAPLPMTPPTGAGDPRIAQYQENAYQVSQGGRYYIWYGCAGCHASGGHGGGPDLGLGLWRHGGGFDAVYASISHGHAGDSARQGDDIPVEQLWQLTAYVRGLPELGAEKRRRADLDAAAEPHDRHGPAALP